MKGARFLYLYILPLIFGYLEILLRASFHAFGYSDIADLQRVTLPSVLAILAAFMSIQPSSGKNKPVIILKYLLMLLIILHPAMMYFKSQAMTGSIATLISSTCSYLVSTLILQRMGFTELFFLGSLLLGVDLLTAGQEILFYVILYLVFSAGLYLVLFYQSITDDRRIRKGSLKLNLYLILPVLLMSVLGYSTYSDQEIPLTFEKMTGDGYRSYWKKLDDFELQGEIRVKEQRIMSVKASEPGYIRAESADYYTGRGWKNTLLLRGINEQDYQEAMEGSRTKQNTVQITLAPDFRTGVIFTIGHATAIEAPAGSLATDGGGNFYIYNAPLGLSYSVTSTLPDTSALSQMEDPGNYPEAVKNQYLQLPSGIPDRVVELARTLTQTAGTNYEKAEIIEGYLRGNYQYDLSISSAPADRDVADYFLFEMKRGYCTYHSTAMVVMLRSVGIPARWVKGFTQGTYNPEKNCYDISLADAHSWVEVYFTGYGWVAFEPTPGFNPGAEGDDQSKDQLKVQMIDNLEMKTDISFVVKKITMMTVGLFFSGGVAVIIYRKVHQKKIVGQEIELIFKAFENTMNKRGFKRAFSQTPLEFAEILSGEFKSMAHEIRQLTDIYLSWKYGGEKPNPGNAQEAGAILKRIRDNI